MNRRTFLVSSVGVGAWLALNTSSARLVVGQKRTNLKNNSMRRIVKTDEEWKRILTSEQYHITREAGTEPPYSSPLLHIHERGVFICVACDLPLFSSRAKYDSQTGWPSFWAPIEKRNVKERVDRSLAETRTEVLCARCDAHLGHVFDDGPPPTALRYCMNGVALKFVKDK